MEDTDKKAKTLINEGDVKNIVGPYKVDQFSYSYNLATGEVIHHHKTKGDIIETNEVICVINFF